VLDAKHSQQAGMASDVAGVGNANSGSATDSLTREHRMTLDEAQLILNVKRDEKLEAIMRVRLTIYRMRCMFSSASRITSISLKQTPHLCLKPKRMGNLQLENSSL